MARARTRRTVPPVLMLFAQALHERIGAERVLLFGSHARGLAALDSDYDFIVVSRAFEGVRDRDRGLNIRDVFYEIGGNAPMDLILLTPEEFERARIGINLVAAVLPEAIELLPHPRVKAS
jgi:uncharacterized protein